VGWRDGEVDERASRQVDADHCTTCGLLYDTQDSRSAECTVRPTVTFVGALTAFLCIRLVHQLPSLENSHTRPKKLPISSQSYLH